MYYIILLGRVVSSNISITHQDFTSKSQLTLHGVIRYSLSVAPGIYGLKCYFVTPCYLNKNRGQLRNSQNDITITLWISAKWYEKSIRNCNVYKNTNIYNNYTFSHFKYYNNFFVLIIYITSVSKKPLVCFSFYKTI